ncbi:MAG: hypothetical protein ACOCWO_01375 [Candidatus Muiribacteriaceae bacterium]
MNEGINLYGILFMAISWVLVIGTSAFCITRILKSDEKKKE